MIRPTAKLSTLKFFLVDNFKSFLNIFLNSIQQKSCLFCDETTFNKAAICSPCYADLPWNTNHCSICSLPLPNPTTASSQRSPKIVCGECISSPPPFNIIIASFRYDIPIGKAIQMLKYHRKRYFATLFAHFLSASVRQAYQHTDLPDCLIPVPMHRTKLKLRGFNQAQLISQKLSRQLSIPHHLTTLQKIKPTPSQTGLSKTERIRNLKKSFGLTDSVKGLHIALVDDVVTTKATSELLCTLLINAGAKRVDVWCIARTAKHSCS